MVLISHSLLSEVVIVRVDCSAECGRLHQPLVHELISAVEGHVDLEEACVRLGEPCLTHVCVETELMLVLEFGEVDRKSVATPNELKVETSFFVGPSLEHSPEALNKLVIFIAARVDGD